MADGVEVTLFFKACLDVGVLLSFSAFSALLSSFLISRFSSSFQVK